MPFHYRIPSPSTNLDFIYLMKRKPAVKMFLLNFNVSVENQLTMLFEEKQIEFKHDMQKIIGNHTF